MQRIDLRWALALAAPVVLAILIGVNGIERLPLDKHEALVVQTATEMLQRGDPIVPYFNGQPRLNKPPLGYWAAIAVHRLRGSDDNRVSIVDGRIVSVLAVLIMLMTSMGLAGVLAGRRPALITGLILAASPAVGFFSHDARPDPLYAALTFAGAALMIPAFLPGPRGSRRAASSAAASLSGWLLWGLATLAKGPHMPLLVALGFAAFAWREGLGWRAFGRALRPFSGALILLGIALPWWWLVQRAVAPGVLADSQLSGTLYLPDPRALPDAIREWAGIVLHLLPWSLLAAVRWPVLRGLIAEHAGARLLAWAVIVPLIVLTLAPQHRWHYVLPLIPFAAILLGMQLDRLASSTRQARTRVLAGSAAIHLLLGAFWLVNGHFLLIWDRTRFAREDSLALLSRPPWAGLPVAALPSIQSAFQVAVHAAGRPIRRIESPAELARLPYLVADRCILVIAPKATLNQVLGRAVPGNAVVWHDRRQHFEIRAVGPPGSQAQCPPAPA